jgi:hypothetical protein
MGGAENSCLIRPGDDRPPRVPVARLSAADCRIRKPSFLRSPASVGCALISHGGIMEVHETHERIHEAGHGHGHGTGGFNRWIAIMISVLACLLAIVEAAGKSAQNEYTASNIEAANLWSFYQAKTIRQTTVRSSAEMFQILEPEAQKADPNSAFKQQIAKWQATAARYESEPETGEGRKELVARAKAAEAKRDHSLVVYHNYEYASAALQIGIVLASVAIVTQLVPLAFAAGALGIAGMALATIAWKVPHLIHF